MSIKWKLVSVIFILFLTGSPFVFSETIINYQSEINYPPYKFVDANYYSGFDIELTNLIFNTEGYRLQYSSDTWDKVCGRLKMGEIDTCGLMAVNEARKKEVLFSKTLFKAREALYTRKNGVKITLENLKNYRVAVGKDHYSEAILRDEIGIKNYSTFITVEDAVDALYNWKVDVLFENQEVVNYLLIKKGLKDAIVPQATNLYPADFAYGVRKNYPQLVEFINNRIDELQKSGTYDELYQKYFYRHSNYYFEMQKKRWILIASLVFFGLVAIISLSHLYIRYLRNKIFRVNQELQRQHEWLRVTLSSIGDAVIATDEKGIVAFINRVAQEYTGFSENESLRRPVSEIMNIINEYTGKPAEIPVDKVIQEGVVVGLANHTILVSKNGTEYSINDSAAPILDDRGKIIGVVMVFQDVTEKRLAEKRLIESYEELEATHEELAAAEEELKIQFEELQKSQDALRLSEERYRLAIEGANDGLWDWDIKEDRIFISPRGKEMLELGDNEAEYNFEYWFGLIHPDDVANSILSINDYFAGRTQLWESEQRVKTRSGEYKWILTRGRAIRDLSGKPVRMAGSHTDITERKSNEEKINYMAYYDSLTGLPNRTLFNDRLNVAMANARRSKKMIALLFLDLDNFKTINDTLGHGFGDQLLKKVGELLKNCMRDGDTIARLGGDEFTLMLHNIENMDAVTDVAGRILQVFQKPWKVKGHNFFITTSIGIAVYPHNGQDEQTLLRNADTAMYHAKAKGKNNYQLYVDDLNSKILERLDVENSLRKAVERREFVVFYQPRVDIDTRKIVGVEALVRWLHPENGLTMPAKFIPTAEETGIITSIDEWVLHTACVQNKAWKKSGFMLNIAVNISAHQFQQKNLVGKITELLQKTGMEPQQLELEITESIAMQDIEYTITVLDKLRETGVRVAMDDFGTGYSSLNYLKRLPINILKIDKSFVHDITVNSSEEAIARAVISLAHDLQLSVIAEGVETEEQWALLRKHECDMAQGYLFSKPLPAEEIEKMLKSCNSL